MKDKFDEKAIIKLLQREDTRYKAFEALVEHYSSTLYWQIRRMVLIHEDADDVLQNTFIKAWTNITAFRGEAKLSTWLYRIAYNECLTSLNKQKVSSGISLDDVDETNANRLESDAYFDGDEIQLKFQKALCNLPERQREVFNLKYFDDMKYEDMSQILNLSVGALKASYHHAVKKIEEFLSNND